MHIEIHGPAHKPAILLSPGLGGSASYWKPQLPALAADFRIVLYDHRGTGRSGTDVPEGYTIADMATEAREVLRQAGVSRCHVIGHALGGLVGLELARSAPDVVDRLVLVNAWAKADRHTLRCFAARLALLDGSGVEAYVQAQPIFLFPAWWLSRNAATVEQDMAHALQHFPGELSVKRRIAALSAFDATGYLASIRHATLLVSAHDDILVPDTASQILLAGLPNARHASMEHGGHACNVVFPDVFNRLCLEFLQG